MSYTLPEFLAHAVAMEEEAAERYLELADMMEAHRNDEVSALFRDMHRFSLMHRDAIRARVGAIELPRLKSWEYRWRTPPEMGDEDAFDYMLDAYHALSYARDNETRAHEYYRSVADEAADAELKRLAGEFAAEEQEHVAALERWIERSHRPSEAWAQDPAHRA